MVVTFKKKTANSGQSMAEMLVKFKGQYGDEVGTLGGHKVDTERLPTAIFPLDLALGGGLPRGKVTMIYGPESSGKTNLCYLSIANHQRIYPNQTCAFVDAEDGFDAEWAQRLGVDTEKLIVLKPDYAEQAVDMIEAMLYTEDCGIVVLDSLVSMITLSELESDASKAVVGGPAQTLTKLVRKTTAAMASAKKQGRMPTLVYINQINFKVGVVYGNPENIPGGQKPKHQSSLIIRVYGKNEFDAKISKTMPVLKVISFLLKKWKVPVLHAEGEFALAMIQHNGLKEGQCDDFGQVLEWLKTFGDFETVKGKGYTIMNELFPTQKAWAEKMSTDAQYSDGVRDYVITRLLAASKFLPEKADADKLT